MVSNPNRRPSSDALRVRELLIAHLCKMIRARNLTQTQAGQWLGLSQPRVSDLLRRRLDKFNVDSLIRILAVGGVRLSIELVDTKRASHVD
jgi:predicted XRE-type DNA-binding protein